MPQNYKQLQELDQAAPRPGNWVLTPRSILDFILGNQELQIEPKFVSSRNSIERCIVSLATNRGLMLIGEPGTAKSYLSDRVMAIPELPDDGRNLYAQVGFNVIATANSRDRGVNEMSAALKRRFNFETIPPINNLQRELELVQQQTDLLLSQANIPISIQPELTEMLVTTFHEL